MNGSGRRKILFVIDSFNIGGAERSLCTLLGLLPAEKFDISVMLASGGGPLEKYLPPDVRLSEIPLCADDLKSRLRFRFHHLRHAPHLPHGPAKEPQEQSRGALLDRDGMSGSRAGRII